MGEVLVVLGGLLLCDEFALGGVCRAFGYAAYDIQIPPLIHLEDLNQLLKAQMCSILPCDDTTVVVRGRCAIFYAFDSTKLCAGDPANEEERLFVSQYLWGSRGRLLLNRAILGTTGK
jgi:hypothetical protein